jgi:hypothetical protein
VEIMTDPTFTVPEISWEHPIHGKVTRVYVDPGTDYNGDICDHCHTVINGVTHRWVEMTSSNLYLILNCSREDSRKV